MFEKVARSFARLSLRNKLMLLAVFVMAAVPMAAAFAQATPETPSSSALITAATSAMTDWNLWPFVIAFAIVGVVIFLARRAVKFVR